MGIVDEAKRDQVAAWVAKLNEGKTFKTALREALDRADKWSSGAWEPVPVPLAAWGALMAGGGYAPGLYPGLHVLAAGTSVGKTALATSIATMAARAGGLVAYFALELSAGQVALRMASELQGFGHWAKVAKGKGGERSVLEDATQPLANAGIWVYEPKPGEQLPIYEWAAAIRGLSDDRGTKTTPLLVLDYTQLVGLGGAEQEARQRLTAAASELRRAARECDVAVLAISSVARASYGLMGIGGWIEAGCEANGNVSNPNAMLVGKESGEIEFFADSQTTILSIQRLAMQTTSALVVAKNREGTLGWAPGLFREGKWSDDVSQKDVTNLAGEAIQEARPGRTQTKPTISDADVKEIEANAKKKADAKAQEKAQQAVSKRTNEASQRLAAVTNAWWKLKAPINDDHPEMTRADCIRCIMGAGYSQKAAENLVKEAATLGAIEINGDRIRFIGKTAEGLIAQAGGDE